MDKLLKSASLVHKSIFVSSFIFENYISGSESNFDLNFCVETAELDNFRKHFNFEEFIYGCKSNVVINFLSDSLKAGFLQKMTPAIWIVLDLSSSKPVFPPQPNLYLKFAGRQEERIEWIKAIFHALKQEKISTKMADLLSRIFSNESTLVYLGFMLARSTNAMRICTTNVRLLSTGSYIAWLKNMGIHGSVDYFGFILDKLRNFIGRIVFSFDINEKIQEQFGVEFYSNVSKGREDYAKSRESWTSILSIIATEGLIHKKKQNELLKWLGNQLEIEVLPPPGFFTNFYRRSVLFRNIDHIKIIFSSQKPPYVKIYFHALAIQCKGMNEFFNLKSESTRFE